MRPNTEDHIPYFTYYIGLIPETDVIQALQNNQQHIATFIRSIPEDKAGYRYAENKWSIKQVINHVIDTERIMSYRALRFSRGDAQLLPGFDENLYADHACLENSSLSLLAEEFETVRKATILFAKQLDETAWLRKGRMVAGEVNVLSLGYFICGHTQHHIQVIKERYLKQ
ncbi:MAG: DinB family protein [Bacteroidetes bacterium]|nr:DinB family protein [Bacteroidota bacterium]